MENRINKVIKLSDNKLYYLLKQAVYNHDSYYTAVEVTEDMQHLTDEFLLLHETNEEGKIYFAKVTDPKMIQLLLKYMKAPEIQGIN